MPDKPANLGPADKPPFKPRIVEDTEPGVGFIFTGVRPPNKNPPSDTSDDIVIEDVTDEVGIVYGFIGGIRPPKKAPNNSP